MTELVEIPAMAPFPVRLPAITDAGELIQHLKAGASLVVCPEPESATAASEPTYRLMTNGQDTFRVGSRIAKGMIGDGRVGQIGKDRHGRAMYIITIKGRS